MKVVIPAGIGRIGDRKGTIPVLSNVLVTCCEGLPVVYATDLQKGVKITCEGECNEGEAYLIPIKVVEKLQSLVNEVEISQDNGKLLVKTGKGKYRLPLQDVEEFPMEAFDNLKIKTPFCMRKDLVEWLLKRKSFAVSREKSKFILQGVHFTYNGEDFYVVATDGYRMSITKIESNWLIEKPTREFSFTVFPKDMKEILAISREGKTEIGISDDGARVIIKDEKNVAFISLVEGEYPDFLPIVERVDESRGFKVDKKEIAQSIKMLGAIIEDPLARVEMNVKDGLLLLKAKISNELLEEEGEVSIPVELIGETEIKMGVAFKFLKEGVESFVAEELKFFFNESMTTLKIIGENEKGYMHFISALV